MCFQYPANVTPVKLYNIKGLVMVEKSIADSHTSFQIPAIQNISFHFHIYVFQVLSIVATYATECSNAVAHRNMCCVTLIFMREWQLVLHTKFIMNIMEPRYVCLFKALHWSTLVHQHRQKYQDHHNHAQFMLCFIIFF